MSSPGAVCPLRDYQDYLADSSDTFLCVTFAFTGAVCPLRGYRDYLSGYRDTFLCVVSLLLDTFGAGLVACWVEDPGQAVWSAL